MSKNQSKITLRLKKVRDYFIPIETHERSPNVQRDYQEGSYMDTLSKKSDFAAALGAKDGVGEDTHRLNMEKIELARLDQEREITNNNLKAQHRTLIMTTIATLIALFSSISAIFIALHKDAPPAPVVNVTPAQQAPADINVYVPKQSAENSPKE